MLLKIIFLVFFLTGISSYTFEKQSHGVEDKACDLLCVEIGNCKDSKNLSDKYVCMRGCKKLMNNCKSSSCQNICKEINNRNNEASNLNDNIKQDNDDFGFKQLDNVLNDFGNNLNEKIENDLNLNIPSNFFTFFKHISKIMFDKLPSFEMIGNEENDNFKNYPAKQHHLLGKDGHDVRAHKPHLEIQAIFIRPFKQNTSVIENQHINFKAKPSIRETFLLHGAPQTFLSPKENQSNIFNWFNILFPDENSLGMNKIKKPILKADTSAIQVLEPIKINLGNDLYKNDLEDVPKLDWTQKTKACFSDLFDINIPNWIILSVCILIFMLVFGYLSFNLLFSNSSESLKKDKMKLILNDENGYYQQPILVTCSDDFKKPGD